MSEPTYTKEAVRAHTNLNVFASVVAILESGCLYHTVTGDATARKIVALCKAEQQRQLKAYDEGKQEPHD